MIITFIVSSCEGPKYRYEEFEHANVNKKHDDFKFDSSNCQLEKERHSNKIEGRKFGFKGVDTGYLGCMRLKGWVLVSDS